jgi:NADH-quinone oxidoreductase subunit E
MTTCTCKEPDLYLAPLDAVLERYQGNPGALIAVLQDAQAEFGYLPEAVMLQVAEHRGVPLSIVYGVATFYAQFRLKPQGKNVFKVCNGTACHIAGADRVTNVLEEELGIASGETTEDLSATLETVACLGCCSLAPVVMVGERTYGRLDAPAVRKLVKTHVRTA